VGVGVEVEVGVGVVGAQAGEEVPRVGQGEDQRSPNQLLVRRASIALAVQEILNGCIFKSLSTRVFTLRVSLVSDLQQLQVGCNNG